MTWTIQDKKKNLGTGDMNLQDAQSTLRTVYFELWAKKILIKKLFTI